MQSTEKKFVPPVKIVAMKNIYKKKIRDQHIKFYVHALPTQG